MTTRFHGKDYVLPITFSPLKREQSLIIEQSNENIKKLQAITEIANLINRFKTNFVLPPDEKAIRYDKDK
ncbi:hypothetical protein IJM86_04065 [bacterium]|nr:hypothetical protein [bacterium]